LSLHTHQVLLPRLQRERTIRVLLPPVYDLADAQRFPVLYVFDGQNLFDAELAFGGQHWEIPETMAQMPPELHTIVVGIDNGEENRLNEYAPFRRGDNGGEGDPFLRDVIECIKPFVDAHYRTCTEAEYTGIAGSSMGGLLALYAGLQYGEVFGRVGVLSPAVWFNPPILEMAKAHSGYKSRFYLSASQQESRSMGNDIRQLTERMLQSGFTEERLLVHLREEGEHGEQLWRNEYPEMHAWLFHS